MSLKDHKRENSLNAESRVELPKDPSVLEPLYQKSSPEHIKELEWKKEVLLHKYKAKFAHQKLMKKLEHVDQLNEKEREELKSKLKVVEKEPPTLEETLEDLVKEQKNLEERDTWEQRRGKRKKNPLIDITAQLLESLKEPFKKDQAW
eukprot:CAMPEP_0205799230 /NCGR_PEP_ID=MMETSP0205-20121125/422_1 /ASSEMBLY_ACC=CAM_ASM_000278 /TAXON_ID=36767 /ORGANISM="Euplotes focardii, Strain TN1" /LENGTH=147 /DNA_ID=CAMNT_0053060177 /DNA_START=824 /DNA_END=1264 /DNA_ORIENTATION=-